MTTSKKKKKPGNSISSNPELTDITIRLAPDLAKLLASGKGSLRVVTHNGHLVLEINRVIGDFESPREIKDALSGPSIQKASSGLSEKKVPKVLTSATKLAPEGVKVLATKPSPEKDQASSDPKVVARATGSVAHKSTRPPKAKSPKGDSPETSRKRGIETRLRRIGQWIGELSLEKNLAVLHPSLREAIQLKSHDFKEFALANRLPGYEDAVKHRENGAPPSEPSGNAGQCIKSSQELQTHEEEEVETEKEPALSEPDVPTRKQAEKVEEIPSGIKSTSLPCSAWNEPLALQQGPFLEVLPRSRKTKTTSRDSAKNPGVISSGRGRGWDSSRR
jgi:hypothetical protein